MISRDISIFQRRACFLPHHKKNPYLTTAQKNKKRKMGSWKNNEKKKQEKNRYDILKVHSGDPVNCIIYTLPN